MLWHNASSSIASAARRLGAANIADRAWGARRLTVLVYHRVGQYGEVFRHAYGTNISATPAMFRRQMEYVARRFTVIDLDTLVQHVRDGAPLPPRPALVTFDDGYQDNYAAAFPILRRLGLPAVIFIITGQIDNPLLPWWDACTRYIMTTRYAEADIPLLGRCRFDGAQARQQQVEKLLRGLKRVSNADKLRMVDQLREALGFETPAADPELFMTWQQVEKLERAGISIQPHTLSHPILTRVPPDEMRREIRAAKAAVEARLGKQALAFAYPNGTRGDYDAQTIACLRAVGCAVAFTMQPGPLRSARTRPQALEIPRIYMGYWDSFDLFVAKVSGLLRYVYPMLNLA